MSSLGHRTSLHLSLFVTNFCESWIKSDLLKSTRRERQSDEQDDYVSRRNLSTLRTTIKRKCQKGRIGEWHEEYLIIPRQYANRIIWLLFSRVLSRCKNCYIRVCPPSVAKICHTMPKVDSVISRDDRSIFPIPLMPSPKR